MRPSSGATTSIPAQVPPPRLSANRATQVRCACCTRFYVQEAIYDGFATAFAAKARDAKVGDGLDPANQMGPLANDRRTDGKAQAASLALDHASPKRTGMLAIDQFDARAATSTGSAR
jgi:acyl-CoA reductase-like NAD-dependent aldehyde dehydrogenase